MGYKTPEPEYRYGHPDAAPPHHRTRLIHQAREAEAETDLFRALRDGELDCNAPDFNDRLDGWEAPNGCKVKNPMFSLFERAKDAPPGTGLMVEWTHPTD